MSLLTKFTMKNVGKFDRVLRALPSAALIVAWQAGVITGGLLVVLGVLAGMLLFTSLTGVCSIYAMLGLSTCEVRDS